VIRHSPAPDTSPFWSDYKLASARLAGFHHRRGQVPYPGSRWTSQARQKAHARAVLSGATMVVRVGTRRPEGFATGPRSLFSDSKSPGAGDQGRRL